MTQKFRLYLSGLSLILLTMTFSANTFAQNNQNKLQYAGVSSKKMNYTASTQNNT